MTLLKDIAWAFNSKDYDTLSGFNTAVSAYNQKIMKERDNWHPEQIVVDSPKVSIAYEYYVTDHDTRFADEEIETEEIYDEQEDGEQEVVVTFTADNGSSFTALELLYKLHQRLRVRELGDHIFFEGLGSFNDSDQNNPPLYYLNCGS